MSNAKYCDHCEELFKEENIYTSELRNFYNEESMDLDLCSDCREQLESWIYGKLNVEEIKERTHKDKEGNSFTEGEFS